MTSYSVLGFLLVVAAVFLLHAGAAEAGGGVKGGSKGDVKGGIKGGQDDYDDGCEPDSGFTDDGDVSDESSDDENPGTHDYDRETPVTPPTNDNWSGPDDNPATHGDGQKTAMTPPTGDGWSDESSGPDDDEDEIFGGAGNGPNGGGKGPNGGGKGPNGGGKGPKGSGKGPKDGGKKPNHGDDIKRFPGGGGGSSHGGGGGVAGAGEPVLMGDDNNKKAEQKDKDDDWERTRRRNNQRAPVVCFIKGDGFERRGVLKYSLTNLPLHKCTHFIYSYVETDNNSGEILYRKKGNLGEKTILRELGRLRHDTSAKEVRTLVSYGAGAHVQSLLNRIRDDKKAQKLIDDIKSMLEQFGLDGINFHLEGPGPLLCKQDDIMTIIKFIQRLRRSVNNMVIITAQLPACRDSKCNLFMSESMSRYLDYVFLITFDYRLDDLTRTKLTSGLYRYKDSHGYTKFETETCVGSWIDAGVPKYKIIPGIATYGRSFTLDNPAFNGDNAKLKKDNPLGNPAEFSNTKGYMNYVETCNRAGYMKWTRMWVKYAATPYIYKGDQWVSYDDRGSADVKVKWFRDRSLGGVFIWSLGEDDYGGSCRQGEQYPMVDAAWTVMKDYWPIHSYRSKKQS
ncbi:endochitinase-like [Rhipicephalus sanguineus]|nr:endochitinase-like [Rhipicephalus sanguineus]